MWPEEAKQDGDTKSKTLNDNIYGNNEKSAEMMEVSLLRVGTVLGLERDAWSMVKWLRHATNKYAPPRPGGVLPWAHLYAIWYHWS